MFLSTRNYDYLYKFIVGASKQSCENLSKESLELKIFEWKKFPSIHFCLKFIFFIISGKIFFKKDRARIKYKNVEIGRFITSQTYCRFDTYLNKVIFYKILFKNFLVAGRMFNACEYYYNKFSIKGVYVDHGGYLNGIIYSYFAQKKNSCLY